MNKSIILVIIIGAIVVGGISYYTTNSNMTIDKDRSTDSFKIGIAQWITSEDFDLNVSEFKLYLELDGHFNENNLEYLEGISNADKSKHQEIIQRFIDEKVDLIFTQTTSGTLIAKEMTRNIPIVFSIVTYPVEAEVIDDLSNSGNNLVGTRNYIPIKVQFDFFTELVPIKKLGFVHRTNEVNSVIQYAEAIEYGKNNGIEIIDLGGTSLEDLENIISKNISNVDVIYQACDSLVQSGGESISIKIATKNKKPTFSCNLDGVRNGALAGKVTNFIDLGHLSGRLAHKILEGSSISDLETEGSTYPYTIINLKTADTLEIKFPEHLEYNVREVVR